jgi:hypothetical protein
VTACSLVEATLTRVPVEAVDAASIIGFGSGGTGTVTDEAASAATLLFTDFVFETSGCAPSDRGCCFGASADTFALIDDCEVVSTLVACVPALPSTDWLLLIFTSWAKLLAAIKVAMANKMLVFMSFCFLYR